MLTAHDHLALARLRPRLLAGDRPSGDVLTFERLARDADRFSACPSVSSVWRAMEFVVARSEARGASF